MERKDQFIGWLKEKVLSNPQEPPASAWEQISGSLDLEETWEGIGEDLDLEDVWQKVDTRLYGYKFLKLFERIGYAVSGLAAIALLFGIWWKTPATGIPGLELVSEQQAPQNQTTGLRGKEAKESLDSFPHEEKAAAQQTTVPDKEIKKLFSSDPKGKNQLQPVESRNKTKRAKLPVPVAGWASLAASGQAPAPVAREGNHPLQHNKEVSPAPFNQGLVLIQRKGFLPLKLPEPLWPAVITAGNVQPDSVWQESKAISSISQFPAVVAGIGSAIKWSALMNNKTMEAFEKTSLVTARPAVYTDVFLTYGMRLNKNYLLQADAYLLDWSGQRYREYRQGSYGEVEDKLQYRTVAISLHRAGRQLGFGAMPLFSQLHGGLYAGVLQKAKEESFTGVSSSLDEFRKWHFGLQLGYGYDVFLLDNLLFTYGLRGRLDLLNIYSGTPAIPADFRKTRNISLDFSLSLKYILKK